MPTFSTGATILILFAGLGFGAPPGFQLVDEATASIVQEVCPSNGMTEAEVIDRWGQPSSTNAAERSNTNQAEGFSYWTYRSRYNGEKSDGPPTPADSIRLKVYFLHGRVIGYALEPLLDNKRLYACVSCTTSGVVVSFSPSATGAGSTNTESDNQRMLLASLQAYRDDWIAGHDPHKPEAGHFVMGHPPEALTPELVAKAFGFNGQLRVADARGTDQRIGWRTQPLWAAGFADDNLTFAKAHIAAYKQGTFLTPDLEAEYTNALSRLHAAYSSTFTNALERSQVLSHSSDFSFRRFELEGDVRGYIRIGFGGCMLVAAVPGRAVDLLISINLPNGDAGPFYRDTPSTHEYYGKMHHNPVQLLHDATPMILDALK